jgi:phosphoglycolate phosphatase
VIEIIHQHPLPGRVRCALFDFDGTLSLIREGWQSAMIDVMVEQLAQTPDCEDERELRRQATAYVAHSTGQHATHQMAHLAAEIRRRSGRPAAPQVYKQVFLDRLQVRVQARRQALLQGDAAPADLMVPDAQAMLEAMHARGVRCYLASGTEHQDLLIETALLGLTPYFVAIYGAYDDARHVSKQMVIQRIIEENQLDGSQFAALGDGFVEIEETRRVSGVAVGVASNESERIGIDEWKRTQLIRAGAAVIVPDFRSHEELAAYLCDGEQP